MGLMREAATKGLAKLVDKIDSSADPEFLLSATDKILNRMGFGPKSGGTVVSVNPTSIQVTAADIQAGRAMIESTGQAFLLKVEEPQKLLPNRWIATTCPLPPFPRRRPRFSTPSTFRSQNREHSSATTGALSRDRRETPLRVRMLTEPPKWIPRRRPRVTGARAEVFGMRTASMHISPKCMVNSISRPVVRV